MNEKLGEIGRNNFGTKMKIIRYGNYDDIDVQFLDDYYYVYHNTTYGNFKNGCIKNPYDKSVFGIGCVGDGKYLTRENGINTIHYNTWHDMLKRCYNEGSKDKFPAYFGICKVCNHWLNMQNFSEWFDEKKYECGERLHIDKDILYVGNKIYSKDTCILVPQRINMLFMNKPNRFGLPNGISPMANGRYSVKYNGKLIGNTDSLEEAVMMHEVERQKAVIRITKEYKEILPVDVYDALMSWKPVYNKVA